MFKLDTLYFPCSPADFEFHINLPVGKRIFQIIPTMSCGQFFFQCLVYLVLCLIVWAQAFLFDMVFTIGKVQAIFGGQHFANFLSPAKIILVANRLAIIVHSVENDMAMRMLTVDMPGNDVLRIFDAHQFHIVVGDLQHQRIIRLQAFAIFRREVERGVSDNILYLVVEQRL